MIKLGSSKDLALYTDKYLPLDIIITALVVSKPEFLKMALLLHALNGSQAQSFIPSISSRGFTCGLHWAQTAVKLQKAVSHPDGVEFRTL